MNNQGFKGIGKINLSISRLILTFMMLLIVVVGGTFAWFTFSSRQSALVLTIGDINNTQITLSPYQVREDNIIPVTGYSNGVYSEVSITNSERANTVTLYYKINELDSTLVNKGLKYTITDSSGSNVIKIGDFKSASGGEMIIYEDNLVNASSTSYRVYLWVDSSAGSQSDIAGKTLNVELNGAIGSVKIRGTNTFGETLVADITDFKNNIVGDSATSPSDYTYQWYYNTTNSTSGGTAISGATSRSYTIGHGLIDKYIYVVAKITRAGTTITYTDITDASSDDGDYNNNTAKVAKRTLSTLTADSNEWVYDGQEHTDSGCTVSNLVTGDTVTCTMDQVKYTKSIVKNATEGTAPGYIPNVIKSYKIMRGTTDVTSNYSVPTYVDGTLTVYRADCSCNCAIDTTESSDKLVLPTSVTSGTVSLSCSYVANDSAPSFVEVSDSNNPIRLSVGALNSSYEATFSSTYIHPTNKTDIINYTSDSGTPSLIGGSRQSTNYNECSATCPVQIRTNEFTVKYHYVVNPSASNYTQWTTSSHKYGYTSKLTKFSTNLISSIDDYGWSFIGWSLTKNSTTVDFADEYDFTYYEDVADGGTVNLYAVYERDVNFYSGDDSARKVDTLKQIWGGNSIAGITTPTIENTKNIDTWTKLGYRNDSNIANDDNVNGFSVLIELSYNSSPNLYALYKRDISFVSGIGAAHNDSDTTQYYSSSGTLGDIVSPNPSTLSSYKWIALGWRGDTAADAAEYEPDDEGKIIPPVTANLNYDEDSNKCTLIAVYNRVLTLYSGYDDPDTTANDKTESKQTQYYNSSNAITPVTLPMAVGSKGTFDKNVASLPTGWSFIGWRTSTIGDGTATYDDGGSTPTYISSASGITFGVTDTIITLYAFYNRTIEYYNLSGKIASDTQYYSSNTSTSVTKFITEDITDAPSGWDAQGFKIGTTAAAQDYDKTSTIGPAVKTSLTDGLYAIYYRNLTFKSGLDEGTNHGTRTQYYNASKTLGTVTAFTATDLSSYGWTTLGWRDDTSPTTKKYNATGEISPAVDSGSILYAVYSRTVNNVYSGLDQATQHTATQYYNSKNVDGTASNGDNVSELTLPTTSAKNSFNAVATAITSWTHLGWRNDTTASTSEMTKYKPLAQVKVTVSLTPTEYIYAVYSRTISYRSGLDEGSTHSGVTPTQYYNSYNKDGTASNGDNVTNVTAPTPTSLLTYGWSTLGWRDDTTANTQEYSGTSISPYATSGNTLYAVYSRNIVFLSGNEDPRNETGERTQYYNSKNVDGTANNGDNVSSIDTFTVEDLGEWKFKGWSGIKDATVADYSGVSGVKITPLADKTLNYDTDTTNYDNKCILYAVYMAEQIVTFYSGLDAEQVVVVSGMLVFSSDESSFPTHITLNIPSAEGTDCKNSSGNSVSKCTKDITSWSKLGYKSSTTADSSFEEFGASLNLEFGGTYDYYAAYSREIVFISGQSKGTVHTPTRTQYYNSYNKDGTASNGDNVSSIVNFTATGITNWTWLGWRGDTTASTQEYANTGNISPLATATLNYDTDTTNYDNKCILYAVYNRTLTFVHGLDEAKSTDTRTQYYNSYGTLGTVTAYTADTTNLSGYGWSAIGWRDDTTAGAKEYNATGSISPAINSANTLYAVYSRTVNNVYSGLDQATQHTATQYYNSKNVDGTASNGDNVSELTLPTTSAKNSFNAVATAITSWTHLGWRNDTTASTSEMTKYKPLAQVKVTVSLTPTEYIYAVYSRTISYRSGVSSAETHSSITPTQYYNSYNKDGTASNGDNVSNVVAPLSLTSIGSAWTWLGWRDDTTANTQEFSGTPISPYATSGNTMYAVYVSTGTAVFYHGKNGDADSTCSSISTCIKKTKDVYYNTNGSSLPTSTTVTPPSSDDNTDITGWTELGYRNDAGTDLATASFGGSASATLGGTSYYYAVYNRSIYLKSGLDETTSKTKTQYYNSFDVVSMVTFETPAAINNCFTALGWRGDTLAYTQTYSTTGNVTPSVDSTITTFYAVYSRSIAVKSGVNGDSSHTTQTQYYNSANTISNKTGENVTNITLPAVSSIGVVINTSAVLTSIGWRDDTTTGDAEYTSESVSPPANLNISNCTMYAVYSATMTVTFYHGQNKAANTVASKTVYYHSYYSTVPASATVTAPTAEQNTNITNWTELGYRNDTTADAKETDFGDTLTLAMTPGNTYTYYAVYSRTATAKFYNGQNSSGATCTTSGKCISKTGTTYYNTNTASLPETASVTVPTKDQTADITGWDELGYRADSTADGKEKDFGATLTLSLGSAYTYYAVYSRPFTLYSGVSGSSNTDSKTQYYNTYNNYKVSGISSNSAILPDDTWEFAGWATSSSLTSHELLPTITEYTDGYFALYAVYSRDATFRGANGSSTTATQTRNYNNVYTVTAPTDTSMLTVTNWSLEGFRGDSTAGDNLDITNLQVATFNAVYSRTFTLTYDKNSTSALMLLTPTTKVIYRNGSTLSSTSITIAAGKPTLTDHTFLGWSESSTGSGGNYYQPSGTYTFSSSIMDNATFGATLFAIWQSDNVM